MRARIRPSLLGSGFDKGALVAIDAALETLGGEDADLDHVQPPGVLHDPQRRYQ